MKNLKLLYKLLETQNNVFWEIDQELKSFYRSYIYDKDSYLIFINKQSTMLLQAHTDTVRVDKTPVIVTQEKNILRANGVLGADDRAGIFAIIEIVKACKENGIEVPNLIFTSGEEIGGVGMKKLTNKIKAKKFKHIMMAIALDRKGAGEYVVYNTLPEEIKNYTESFGWNSGYGTFSDIEIFTTKYHIPSINISVGYHNAHMQTECLHLDELNLSLIRLEEMLKEPMLKKYEAYEEYTGSYLGHHNYNYDGYNYAGGQGFKMYDNKKYQDEYVKNDFRIPAKNYCELCEGYSSVIYDVEGMRVCLDCYDYLCRRGDINETIIDYKQKELEYTNF